jgi:hypothetical protein
MTHGELYLGGDCSENKGLLCNLVLESVHNAGDVVCTVDTAMAGLLKYAAPSLIHSPVFLSSNMGDPYGHTAWFIEQLQVRAADILRDYGVDVVAPSDYATNPNMNYHYIDSVNLSIVNFNKFQEAICPDAE